MPSSLPSLVNGSPRKLGSFEVGALGFGCWRFTNGDTTSALALVERALELGMNLIDTADVYGLDYGGTGFGANEEILGQVLAAAPELRDQMVLATKGGIMPPLPYDSSASYLRSALEASLRRLNVDVIDLYQIHRPDFYTHPEELAATLTAFRSEGKIREVGVSNFSSSQADALQTFLPFSLASDQPQFSLLHTDPLRDGTLDRAMREQLTPLAWSPLAGGALATGTGLSAALTAELDRLAQREGVSRSEIALAWVLAHPSRPVALVGSQKLERLGQAVGALRVELDRGDVYALLQAAEGEPLP